MDYGRMLHIPSLERPSLDGLSLEDGFMGAADMPMDRELDIHFVLGLDPGSPQESFPASAAQQSSQQQWGGAPMSGASSQQQPGFGFSQQFEPQQQQRLLYSRQPQPPPPPPPYQHPPSALLPAPNQAQLLQLQQQLQQNQQQMRQKEHQQQQQGYVGPFSRPGAGAQVDSLTSSQSTVISLVEPHARVAAAAAAPQRGSSQSSGGGSEGVPLPQGPTGHAFSGLSKQTEGRSSEAKDSRAVAKNSRIRSTAVRSLRSGNPKVRTLGLQ